MDSRYCAQHAIFPLTDNERGACDAALHLSQHTKIELLPNVHINEKMELSGFQFDGAGCDMASVLLRVQTKTQYTHRRVKESHRKDA